MKENLRPTDTIKCYFKLRTSGDIPNEITLEDKSSIEQLNLIKQLDEDDRSVVFKIIDTMLTKYVTLKLLW